MAGELAIARGGLRAGFLMRLKPGLRPGRVAVVALVALLLSLNALVSPAVLDFFSPAEIALAWLEYFAELAIIGFALLLGFAVLDEALPRGMPFRLGTLCAAVLAQSAALSLLLHAYYAGGLTHLPPLLRIVADAMRWGLPAVFLALIADLHRRALQADGQARRAELARARMEEGAAEQQLALLRAQIEPHFLFNMLANVRRLYRAQPERGAEAMENLMRYLRTALPQLRSSRTTLGEELDLVRAYLRLFELRTGGELAFSIEAERALGDLEFPPMLLITLVENAVKHGIGPAGGGRIEIRARRRQDALEVTVADDGVGFAAAPGSGTGVGLANVRRQLFGRYPGRARLTLEAREPRGAIAGIVIPAIDARDGERQGRS